MAAIKPRRGVRANLPESAPEGELLICIDSGELFLGTGSGTKQLAVSGSTYRYAEKVTQEDTKSASAVTYHTVTLAGFHAGVYRIDFSAVFGCSLSTADIVVRLLIDGGSMFPTDIFTRVAADGSRQSMSLTRDVLLAAGSHIFTVEFWREPAASTEPTLTLYSASARATRVS